MPLKSQLHIDKLLSNVSLRYSNSEYIHNRVFPALPVKKSSDKIRIHTRDFRLQETARDHKGLAREVSHEYTHTGYSLHLESLKDYISQNEMENNDVGSLRADTVEELTEKIMIRKEYDCAKLFTSTNWSQNVSLAAANAFTAETTVSNPIPVFDTAGTTILKKSGKKANFAIIPHDGMIAAKNHPSVLDRVKYTSAEITPAMLSSLFDVGEILVSSAQYDTAAKGVAESLSDIWNDHAFVGYRASSPSMKQVSAGYMVTKAGMAGNFVRRWTDEERLDAEAIEVNSEYQFKVVASLAGFLIKDVV